MSSISSTPFQPLFNPHQVAEMLNVQRSTICTWTAQGRLQAIRINGRLRFHSDALKNFLVKESQGSKAR